MYTHIGDKEESSRSMRGETFQRKQAGIIQTLKQ